MQFSFLTNSMTNLYTKFIKENFISLPGIFIFPRSISVNIMFIIFLETLNFLTTHRTHFQNILYLSNETVT